MSDKLRLYISFANENRGQVRTLEARLRTEGFDTWFDEKDWLPGSDWKNVIDQVVPSCDFFISCVSTQSVRREGFYETELRKALGVKQSRLGFVVIVRLDNCELPEVYREAGSEPVDVFDDAGVERLIRVLKDLAGSRRAQSVDQRVELIRTVPKSVSAPKLIRILHLSDLHFKQGDDHKQMLSILDEDLPDTPVDYLVVSGDLSDRCNAPGYQMAAEFLCELQKLRSISPGRCILVPGNHDVQRDLGSFELRDKVDQKDDAIKALAGDLETTLYLVRKTGSYADRFRLFADVYKKFTGSDYDLTDPGRQFCIMISDAHRLQFLGLNSAWKIDQFRPKRATINDDALDEGLKKLRQKQGYLGIAVWHHAITGNDKIPDDAFLGRLSRFGVRLCLHGDVHELRPDIVSPYSEIPIHVVGVGSFGAGPSDRPESTPRMYNLIEINEDHTQASVSTRQQPRPGLPFRAYATWFVPGQKDIQSGRYTFKLAPPALGRAAAATQ